MTIQDALEYIHNVKWQGSKPGLSRTRELLVSLGNPEKKLKYVHVAGTNGKGSTCACIASVLQNAGYKTGLYISPYIFKFNERMQIDGTPISDAELVELVKEVRPYADAMADSPTEFELITALSMLYFYHHNCDIVVLEVGMGGELDSTNVIDTPELAVITAIDYDHMEQLGPTLRDIAKAKAGIIKTGGDVLVYGGTDDVEEVFECVASGKGARVHKAGFSRIKSADITPGGTMLTIEPYGEIMLPLAGLYQHNNALMAVTAIELLREKNYNISNDNIVTGLTLAKWPGRFEFLGRNPDFILDGAHNPHGVKAAAESLRAYYKDQEIIIIMGVLADKDVHSMIEIIAPITKQVFTVMPDNPRAMDADKLAQMFRQCDVPAVACLSISEGVKLAMESAGENGRGNVICALGSLFMSADIREAYYYSGN